MKLEIISGTNLTSIEINDSSGCGTAGVECVRLPDGKYSIVADGRVYDLYVELEGDACSVSGRAGSHMLQIRNPRRPDLSRSEDPCQAGPLRLKADMPGKVIRVLVREGETVANGQGLLIIEAMKMQNEIRSPKAGTVKSVAAVAGRNVNSGDFLLSVE